MSESETVPSVGGDEEGDVFRVQEFLHGQRRQNVRLNLEPRRLERAVRTDLQMPQIPQTEIHPPCTPIMRAPITPRHHEQNHQWQPLGPRMIIRETEGVVVDYFTKSQ